MSAHKVLNYVALHGENLKMGKAVPGVERGKFACGECEDFMRSYGATLVTAHTLLLAASVI